MNDMRVDIKVRNNRLITLIEEQYGNVAQFCKTHKMSPQKVGDYCNFKETPLRQGKNSGGIGWKESAEKIADALGVLPDEIWPEHMQELKLKVNTGHTAVSSNMMSTLLGAERKADPVLAYEKEETEGVIAHVLRGLTDREQKVLALRYGLGGGDPMTFDETGEAIDLSRERVRQIEAKALRKMRHPSRSDKLKTFLEED